jgi:hypothetical protein
MVLFYTTSTHITMYNMGRKKLTAKDNNKINAIEPRNDRLIELIKKYIFYKYDDDSMLNAILTEYGSEITREELVKWKSIALREKKEAKMEIDVYLSNMIELGMYEDVMMQYELSKSMLITNSKTYNEMVIKKDVDRQVMLTNAIDRQMEGMRRLVTSIGYMTKAKEVLEKGFSTGLEDKAGTSITIEAKPGSSFDEVVNQSIGEMELKDNAIF